MITTAVTSAMASFQKDQPADPPDAAGPHMNVKEICETLKMGRTNFEHYKAELIAAVTEANEPIVKRLEALEKSATPAAPATGDPVEEPATLDDVVDVVGKLADRLGAIEKARGERTSVTGQDNPEPVKKSRWAGIF